MNPLHNLSLRASTALFAAIAVLAIAALSSLSWLSMKSSESLADRVQVDIRLTRAAGTADMMHDALRADTLAAQLAGAQAPAERKKAIIAAVGDHAKTLAEQMAVVEEGAQDVALREALVKVKPALQAYQAQARQLVDAALAGATDVSRTSAFDTAFSQLEDRLGELGGLIEATSKLAVADQAAMFSRARWTLGIAAAAGTLVLSLFGLGFVNATLGLLGAEPRLLRTFSLQIADGKLGAAFGQQPPASSVGDAMLRMQKMLSDTVRGIRSGAESVASASQQLAQGNQDLSQRTEEQASTLEQTAASMEQLGATIRQNSDNARQANQLAAGASSVAVKGGEVVGQVIQTMKGINDSSRKIADIIGVIDGIAFQTNILALNAAVEAARAGEQGRGFAVVASEVRSLASRSAEAAKEIKTLIGASVERVEEGTALVDQAGVTMTEVVASIKRVTDLMGEISSASVEQSAGVTQVGEAVVQMDKATQQNAALVEESAAAAESLQQQARALVQAVTVFDLQAA